MTEGRRKPSLIIHDASVSHHLWENMSHSLQRKWVPAFYTCTCVVILQVTYTFKVRESKLLTCPSSSVWAQCQITSPDARWKPGIPLSRKSPGWLIGMTGIQIHWSCMCCHSEQWAVFTPKCLRDAKTIKLVWKDLNQHLFCFITSKHHRFLQKQRQSEQDLQENNKFGKYSTKCCFTLLPALQIKLEVTYCKGLMEFRD